MNATAKWILCGAGFGLALSAPWAAAAPLPLVPSLAQLATVAVGAEAESEASYLAQARQAMAAGRFDEADALINKAAALGVKPDPLTSRFADSPAKARAELERVRGPKTPSSRFEAWPPAANRGQPSAEPKRDAGATDVSDETLHRLTSNNKSAAVRYLENGRQALRNRDLTSALAWHQKAVAEKATFAAGEYSPDALANELRAAGAEPSRLPPAPRFGQQSMPQDNDGAARLPSYSGRDVAPNSPVITSPDQIKPDSNPLTRGTPQVVFNNTTSSRSPLAEARKALAYADVRKASELANQARQQGHRDGSDSPEAIEALIKKSNQLGAGPKPGQEAQFARNYSDFLMEQSEGLLAHGEVKDAERLAQQAKNMRVRYSAGEKSPDGLLTHIASLKSQAEASAETRVAGPAREAAAPRRLPTAGEEGPSAAKQHAARLMANARIALDRGDVVNAHRMAEEAHNLKIPDSEFGSGEMRPWELVMQTSRAMNRRGGDSRVVQAGAVENATYNDRGGYAVERGVYNPANDRSRVAPAQAAEPAPLPATGRARPVWDGDPNTAGQQFFDAGMKAFVAGDRDTALQHFKQATKYSDQLDPATRSQLKDKMIALQSPRPERFPEGGATTPLAKIDQQTELLRQKLLKEIQAEDAAAERMIESDPEGALKRLVSLRERVNAAELDPPAKKQLLTFVDRKIDDMERYIEGNRADIDLNNANRAVREDIAREQALLIETQTKLAQLVEDFNRLIDEQRYHEAEVVAKQAREIAPNEPVVQNMVWKSQFITQIGFQQSLTERKNAMFLAATGSVDEAGTPFDDREPYVFNDAREWGDLTNRRRKLNEQSRRRLSPIELEIQKSLTRQVEVNFVNRPLAEVMDTLGKMANVNIHLDPQGLHAEGVTSDTPVTLNLATPISLKSALNIILEQLRLGYVIQNEVLQVTSQQTRAQNLSTVVYNVGDLVIPIPNFTPSGDMGLAGAIRDAHNTIGYGGSVGGGAMPFTFAANQQQNNSLSPLAINPKAMAQMGINGGSMASGRPEQFMSGPGSLGGAAMADFDSLIDLITSTVHPESWKEGGTGEGTIAPFPTNLSIVVSQTEEVHQAISDLLDQLRRLQDLQVTIEVRFITLNDNFFERIGIDFDFNIDDNSGAIAVLPDDVGPSITVGLDPQGQVTANRDLQFTQNSFSTAIPQFGGFDPATAANFGFAILSDIEVFFLLQAATGDTRTNVLQAPKVTLFNGQQAVVSDTSQRPFVTSVIPVVGDFAAAHQPVITVLSEGTSLSVQAVVSADRRFVRLTLVPFFSQIGDVEEFTFNGRTTTNTGSSSINPIDPDGLIADDAEVSTEGTTVQLPTFAFTTVTTTVSVPDGGTVLLGGIKRLSEGRSERGVPLLSKVPYASRLFKNVGIGRTTQSLMMMVTPRIIIQEEEEEKLGINSVP